MDLKNTDDSNLFVPNEMNTTQLPSITTIYRHVLYLLTILKCIKNKIATVIRDIPNSIIEIWQSASLTHIPFDSVRVKVGRLVKSVNIIKKSNKKSYYKDYFIIIILL